MDNTGNSFNTKLSKKLIRKANKKGFFKIGIYMPQSDTNIGSLLRMAYCMGASEVFYIRSKGYEKQATDTLNSWKHMPLVRYDSFDTLYNNLPYSTQLVGIELSDLSESIIPFEHPERAVYLLGAEGNGLPLQYQERCHSIIELPSLHCLNVSHTGSIVMYDRISKKL